MIVFTYDHTFDGLLTCLFEVYNRKKFPDILLKDGEPLPLFVDEVINVETFEERHQRVCQALFLYFSRNCSGKKQLTFCAIIVIIT